MIMQIGSVCMVVWILQFMLLSSGNNIVSNNSTLRQAKKLWSILTLVHFANDGCIISGTYRKGTCYTKKQCLHRGGLIGGKCAKGFGVCCLFLASCGGRTEENCVYFINPQFPSNFILPADTSAMCNLQVVTNNPNTCQLRLDFLQFDLFGVQEGECQVDLFTITGSSTSGSVPQLCGSNNGQHIYLNVPRGRNIIELKAIFQYLFDNPSFGRKFEIKISQIQCTSELLAPSGCLQYFSGPTGVVTSFNYAGNSGLSEGYPINQNYGICIRKQEGFCSIRYSADGPFQFGISDSTDGAQTGINCMPGAPNGGNRDDYLIIAGGSSVANPMATTDRYCGGAFSPTTTSVMPYVINVISGDKYDGEVGFRLQYEQIPCTN